MIPIKNKMAFQRMRIAGKLLAEVMEEAHGVLKPGITTYEVDQCIENSLLKRKLLPVCKGYAGYKHASCISVNSEVVHSVPSKEKVLAWGDIVSIDIVGAYHGYCADMARTFVLSKEGTSTKHILIEAAQKALDKGIEVANPGNRVGLISSVIEKEVTQHGFAIVQSFAGHGIGKRLHEEPEIPNFLSCPLEETPFIREGMAFAIEPMISEKNGDVVILADGWTAVTVDGSLAAHVEDTILIGQHGVEIITRLSHA